MKKIVLAAACAVAGLAVNAKTVAWYRFDDAPVGTKANAQSAFLNAVDPAKHPGYFRTWAQAPVGYWNKPPVITDGESEYYPDYSNGFRKAVQVLDPAAGRVYENGTALRLNTENPASASGKSAILLVDDDEDLHLKSFTYEFFVRILPESCDASFRFLSRKLTDNGKRNLFEIHMHHGSHTISSTLCTATKDPVGETNIWHSATAEVNSLHVNDGLWHRVAFIVDDEQKTLSLYVDGVHQQDGRQVPIDPVPFEGEVDYDGAGVLAIGAPPNDYYGNWQGFIDEVRISDKALTKDELLQPIVRPETVPATVTSDTLLYVDFEGSDETVVYDEFATGIRPSGTSENLKNKAMWNPDFRLDPFINYVTSETYPKVLETAWPTNDTPSALDRAGLTGTNFAANAAAYHFGTNSAAGGAVMAIPRLDVADTGHYLVSDSFTVEFYLKMAPGDIEFRHTNQPGYIMMQSGAFTIYCNLYGRIQVSSASGSFYFMRPYNGHSNTYECYNDGKWHHLALVYDKEASLGLFYIDGEYRAYQEGAVFDAATTEKQKNLCIMGGYWGADMRFCDAAIDDIRFTRGALRPYQFLTTRAIEGSNLGYAAFDGDYVISPYADLFKAATASNAAFATERPARIILDGKDGEPIREKNTRSVALSGGSVTWAEHDIVTDSEKVTAEFFVKTQTAGAPLLAVGDIWSLDSSLTLAVGAESAAPESAAGLADGAWHHVAVVFDGATAKVYLDYEVALEHVFASAPATAKAADLVLGGEGFTGNLDELRFTPSVLAADDFLTAFHQGVLMLLR